MFNRPIVLIVGAGASHDVYGLPLGGSLASKMAQDTDFFWDSYTRRPSRGDPKLYEELFWAAFPNKQPELNQYTAAAQQLSSAISSTISVDDALFQLSDNPLAIKVGKACIMRAILLAERESILKTDPAGQPDPKAGRDGWIEQIFSMAITGFKLVDIKHAFNRITFVNFNYDRCIEHYIYWALRRLRIDGVEARETVERLRIIRPYGSLGSIFPGKDHLAFGGASPRDFFSVGERIRTFTDATVLHNSEQLQSAIAEAAMIVFLGFGYHAQNLTLLQVPANTAFRPLPVLATAVGIHHANTEPITSKLAAILKIDGKHSIELHDMSASKMLKNLRVKISFNLS